jgi:hypothetical protein
LKYCQRGFITWDLAEIADEALTLWMEGSFERD